MRKNLFFTLLCLFFVAPVFAQQNTGSSVMEIVDNGPYAATEEADTIIRIKMKPVDTLTPEEKIYMEQTHNEADVTEEKGSAVFFGKGGKIKGTDMYYGFHNTAPKGTIIKVYNPGTDRTVYVKVLSVIPGTKQYHNSIIGISAGAMEELGTIQERVWCELSYGL